MLERTFFVQEPDYVGFRKVSDPIKALGVIYDGEDPYATPLGVVFSVYEGGRAREVYVPRAVLMDNDKTVYLHDLNQAHYIAGRNGFEVAQLSFADGALDEGTRAMVRGFFTAQNQAEGKYLVSVCG
jgi:hypothetical protein